ncbi:MAG: hypothetical protein EOP47_16480 [Sphingobacteriaceae bacterium]|nr:MAG: hypothetical protein EOP47_16480 [Sphingobacteriaceae bacterium]
MKLINILLGVIIITSVALYSCQKEYSINGGIVPQPTLSDSVYIDKIYYLDDASDTAGILVFNYDSQKRIISIKENNTDIFLKYEYNGTDTVPSRKYEYNDTDSIYTYFILDNQQRVLYDSSITFIHAFGSDFAYFNVKQYQYSMSKLYGESKLIYNNAFSSDDTTYHRDTAMLTSFGDISSNKTYRFNGVEYEHSGNAQFVYDVNQKGLYAQSGILKAHFGFPNNDTVIPWEFMSYKNVLSQTEEDLDPLTPATSFTYTYNYEYNSKGLTKKMTTIYGVGDQFTVLISYRNL